MLGSRHLLTAGPLVTVLLLAVLACSSRPAPGGRDGAVVVTDAAAPVDAPPPVDAGPPIDAGPATRELRPAVETFFTRLGAREPGAIWTDAHPSFRAGEDRRRAERMMRLLVEPLGRFQAIAELRTQAGKQPGENAALGTAKFERGVASYQVVFRDDGDVPRLLFFNIDLPKELIETPAQARVLVDRAMGALLSGNLEKLRPFAHPALDEKLDAAQARELKDLLAKLGKATQIELVSQAECPGQGHGQCFVLTVTGVKQRATATFRLTKVFGRWLVLSFDLELA